MIDNGITLLGGNIIAEHLNGRELQVMDVIAEAYKLHSQCNSSLPHSSFLRFPEDKNNRIIALPAFLGGEFNVAGIKWISSFPDNIDSGMDRASAVLVLNSTDNGRAKAVLESSVISAKRTAASAVLAANKILGDRDASSIGLFGNGLINFEILRFFMSCRPETSSVYLYDIKIEYSEKFLQKCARYWPRLDIRIFSSSDEVLECSDVCSFATTASQPHIADISMCKEGCVLLNVSLRDLSPEVILSGDNIVDDIDHVCRAQTSIHLTEQQEGNRDFIRTTIGQILTSDQPSRPDKDKVAIFSPFGLGILDLALADYVYSLAKENGEQFRFDNFYPDSWRGN